MPSSDSMNSSDLSSYSNPKLALARPNTQNRVPTCIGDGSAHIEDFSDAVLYLASLAEASLEDAQDNVNRRTLEFGGFESFSRYAAAMALLPCSRTVAIAAKMKMAAAKIIGENREITLPADMRKRLMVSAQRDQFAGLGVLV